MARRKSKIETEIENILSRGGSTSYDPGKQRGRKRKLADFGSVERTVSRGRGRPPKSAHSTYAKEPSKAAKTRVAKAVAKEVAKEIKNALPKDYGSIDKRKRRGRPAKQDYTKPKEIAKAVAREVSSQVSKEVKKQISGAFKGTFILKK